MTERAVVPVVLAALAGTCIVTEAAHSLPLYTARSGRGCDTCHTDPTDWENPRLADRKCNLSCMGCHTDPSGGGLRTVSGEFYGQSTLPMFLPSHRGYEDWDRQPFWSDRTEARKNRVPDFAWGTVAGDPTPNTWSQERYAGLNADPILSIGLDARMAAWLAGEEASVFPMQGDAHVGVHPVHHVTAAASGGVLAETAGVAATAQSGHPVGLKDAWLMGHELPFMAYVRAGRFVPPFGTRTEDHTSWVRREHELDGTRLGSRVTGVEVGLAPNYPYAQVALFRPGAPDPAGDAAVGALGVDGWGAAVSAGVRELGWQAGASGMVRRRALEDGGNTDAVSLQAGLNPWFYSPLVPLTLLGEYSYGQRQRTRSGTTAGHVAGFVEADVLVFNGLNLRTKVDFVDPDTELAGDDRHRLGFGGDLHLLPNTTLTGQVRVDPGPRSGEEAVDIIVFTHLWL